MGIKNKQIVRLTNNLLQEELVNGKMPTVRELLSKMSYKLNETLLGGPSMKLNLAKENSSVDTKSHNETLHQIASDIDLLYEELIEQTGRIANSFMYNATQVESLNRNIEETLNELNSLILIADNTNDYVYTIYDFFNDYSNIDMVESDVDIDNGAVVLGTKVFNNVRHNSSKYTVTFVPTIYPSDIIYNTKIVGDIASTVDGNQDTMWQYIISSKRNGEYSFKLDIDMHEAVVCNKIVLNLNSPADTNVVVRYSPDNKLNWFTIPQQRSGRKDISIQFDDLSITNLEITFVKTTSDTSEINENGAAFNYYFGIKDIGIYRNEYMEGGTLVSKEYTVNTPSSVSKISLHANHESPTGTDITYSISLNNNDWIKVSPANSISPKYDQVITLNSIGAEDPETYGFDGTTPPSTYEVSQYRTQGISFYKLAEIEDDVIDSTIKLYKGKDAWSYEVYSQENCIGNFSDIYRDLMTKADTDLYNTNVILTSNFTAPSCNYIEVDSENKTSITQDTLPNTISHYSISFISDIDNVVSTSPVFNKNCVIYFNNVKIFSGETSVNTKVSYNIKGGMNTIDIFVFSNNSSSTILDVDINVYKVSNYVYAHRAPLTQTSLFNLRYNTKYTDYTKFAIASIDGVKCIIVNNYMPSLKYDMFYRQSVTQLNTIKVKAELSRDKAISNIGPRIYDYQVRFL